MKTDKVGSVFSLVVWETKEPDPPNDPSFLYFDLLSPINDDLNFLKSMCYLESNSNIWGDLNRSSINSAIVEEISTNPTRSPQNLVEIIILDDFLSFDQKPIWLVANLTQSNLFILSINNGSFDLPPNLVELSPKPTQIDPWTALIELRKEGEK